MIMGKAPIKVYLCKGECGRRCKRYAFFGLSLVSPFLRFIWNIIECVGLRGRGEMILP